MYMVARSLDRYWIDTLLLAQDDAIHKLHTS
jgi:hypothetical protein